MRKDTSIQEQEREHRKELSSRDSEMIAIRQSYQMQHRETASKDIPDRVQPFTEGLVEGQTGSSSSAGETIPKTRPPLTPARLSNKSGGKHQRQLSSKMLDGMLLDVL